MCLTHVLHHFFNEVLATFLSKITEQIQWIAASMMNRMRMRTLTGSKLRTDRNPIVNISSVALINAGSISSIRLETLRRIVMYVCEVH